MSRWTAYKAGRNAWTAHRKGEMPSRLFRTHAEAQAYADRMARTVEVVLPRVAPQGEISVSATWYCDQGAIHYINPSGQAVQGTPAELRPLALALLALAEQEDTE